MKIEKQEQKLVDKDTDKGYGKFGYGVELEDIIILLSLWFFPYLIILLISII
jgi:hypothetical protein